MHRTQKEEVVKETPASKVRLLQLLFFNPSKIQEATIIIVVSLIIILSLLPYKQSNIDIRRCFSQDGDKYENILLIYTKGSNNFVFSLSATSSPHQGCHYLKIKCWFEFLSELSKHLQSMVFWTFWPNFRHFWTTVVSGRKEIVGLRPPITIRIHLSTEISKTSHPRHLKF